MTTQFSYSTRRRCASVRDSQYSNHSRIGQSSRSRCSLGTYRTYLYYDQTHDTGSFTLTTYPAAPSSDTLRPCLRESSTNTSIRLCSRIALTAFVPDRGTPYWPIFVTAAPTPSAYSTSDAACTLRRMILLTRSRRHANAPDRTMSWGTLARLSVWR